MATWNGWGLSSIILDDLDSITSQEWSSVINKEFWNLLYTEECEWDE